MRAGQLSLVLSLAFLTSSLAPAAEPALAERSWKVDGTQREALIYVPAESKQAKAPVVFAFHGHGGSMVHAARTFAYHKHWPEAICLYMQGLNTPGRLTDPEGKKAGWQHSTGDQQDRDLKFFDAVLASLQTEYKVDQQRIYATGHSNGGSFTYLLWANRGETFAAFAPSGSTPGRELNKLQPKPVLHVAGETDPLVRFAWQQRGIESIQKLNGCATDGKPWAKAGVLVGTEYASPTGTPLITLIHLGGHKFPDEAPELIVKFFKGHERKQ